MTDGDITRLNRMYRCPNFKEVSLDEMYDDRDLQLEEHEENDFKMEEEITSDALETTQLSDDEETSTQTLITMLKRISRELHSAIKPLCEVQHKVKSALTFIDHM